MTFVVHFRRTLRHATFATSRRASKADLFRQRHLLLLVSLLLTYLLYNARSSIVLSSHTLETVVRHAAYTPNYATSPIASTSTSADTDIDIDAIAARNINSVPGGVVPPAQRAAAAAAAAVPPPLLDDAYEPLPSQVDAIVGKAPSAKKVLMDVYALPPVVVSNMTQHVATRLYWKLVYTDVIRALRQNTPAAAANPSAPQPDVTAPHSGPTPRATVLFVHTQNGLGNRLRSLASGLSIARATQRVPVVVWQRDAHLGATLSDLLRIDSVGSDINTVLYKDLIVMEDFPTWQSLTEGGNGSGNGNGNGNGGESGNDDGGESPHHWRAFNYMQKDGAHARTDALMRFELPADPKALSQPPGRVVSSDALHAAIAATPRQPISTATPSDRDAAIVRQHEHVYFKSAYVAKASPAKLSSRSVINSELRALTPSPAVWNVVQKMDETRLRHSYGVHVRSRTLEKDNVAVNNACEYTRVGAYTTDYWRARSQVPVFVAKMRQKLRMRKDATFFVAADDTAVMQTLKKEFPGRVDTIQRDCDDRDGSCVVYAMADLLCLAKTRRIYGSNWSSFSEVAGRLSNRRLYLSGRDFGKAKRMSRWMRALTLWPVQGWRWWLSIRHPFGGCGSRR